MLIDKDNNFMTQRIHTKMALFKWLEKNGQWFIHFGPDVLAFPLIQPSNDKASVSIRAKIWDDEVEVSEVSEEYSRWFSERLKIDCRLVAFPEENERLVDADYRINDEQVSLADAYPFLIIGEQSLADLNARLNVSVPMNRFRPNFVFSGGAPYEEDHWKEFSIGAGKFAAVKRCARCVLITVDQDTGEKGTEPLTTLSSYRRENNKVFFGQNVLAINHNEIHEGDKITVNYRK